MKIYIVSAGDGYEEWTIVSVRQARRKAILDAVDHHKKYRAGHRANWTSVDEYDAVTGEKISTVWEGTP